MAHEAAKERARRAFDGRCVFRGTIYTDPMHFYPAGDFTVLADEDDNIFPGCRDLHSTPDAACFDWALNKDGTFVVRSMEERLWILYNLTLLELRPRITMRLTRLKFKIFEMNHHGPFVIAWPVPKQPEDLHELLCGFKVRREREDRLVADGARTLGEIRAEP